MKKVGITDLIMALSYLQDAQIDAGTIQVDHIDIGAYRGLTSCHLGETPYKLSGRVKIRSMRVSRSGATKFSR